MSLHLSIWEIVFLSKERISMLLFLNAFLGSVLIVVLVILRAVRSLSISSLGTEDISSPVQIWNLLLWKCQIHILRPSDQAATYIRYEEAHCIVGRGFCLCSLTCQETALHIRQEWAIGNEIAPVCWARGPPALVWVFWRDCQQLIFTSQWTFVPAWKCFLRFRITFWV